MVFDVFLWEELFKIYFICICVLYVLEGVITGMCSCFHKGQERCQEATDVGAELKASGLLHGCQDQRSSLHEIMHQMLLGAEPPTSPAPRPLF